MEKIKISLDYCLKTPTLLSILAGGVLLAVQILYGLTPSVQIGFFVFFMVVTGIPHGALDHLVEAQTLKKRQITFKLPFFFAKYLLTMTIYGVVWYALPTPSLLFFLIMSAWHFGETDLDAVPFTKRWQTTRFLFGGLILAILLLTHAAEVTPIWARIVRNDVITVNMWKLLTDNTFVFIGLWSVLFVLAFTAAQYQVPTRFDKNRFLRLAAILLLAYFLPLLPAFALYFGGWHAVCSFQSIQNYLLQNNQTTFKTPLSIWHKSLPFTAIALLFLTFMVWYWQHFLQNWDPIPVFFIFLSLITLPHLNVMHSVNTGRIRN